MKNGNFKKAGLRLSVAAVACLAAASSFAADSLESAFTQGKASGNVQAWYINDSFNGANNSTGKAGNGTAGNPKARGEAAVGGVLGFTTSPYYGINAGVEFASSNLLGQNPNAGNSQGVYGSATSSVVSSIDYNVNVITQAYLQGQYGKTIAKVGYQSLQTPLADSTDGARIFYNTFKAGVLINQDLPQTTLIAADVTGEQTRTTAAYGSGVPGSAGATNNAQASINNGYQAMSQVAFGNLATTVTNNNANSPVYAFAAVNSSLPGLTAQAWFYNAVNVLNAYVLQADYKLAIADINTFAGAQYINEQGIGGTQNVVKNVLGLSGGVNSNYFALKAGAGFAGITGTVAYSQTGYSANSFANGSLITPWGGSQTTLYTSAMIANATAGGTKATQLKAQYDADGILKGLTAIASYTLYAAKQNATAGISYGTLVNQGLGIGSNAVYGELKYQVSKPFAVRWRIEQDSLIGASSSTQTATPKAALESRLMAQYSF